MLFQRRSTHSGSPDELYRWHVRPGALERLVPPWTGVRALPVEGGPAELAEGSRRTLSIPVPTPLGPSPVRLRWVAEHRDLSEGAEFTDVQVKGPFKRWVHRHRFLEPPEHARVGRPGVRSVLEDRIDFEPRFGPLGRAVARWTLLPELERQFAFRHRRLRDDMERHAATDSTLKVAITGASGLVGGQLASFLTTGGHEVVRLVRREPSGPGEVRWDPPDGPVDARSLDGVDAVVHLAGEPIVSGRWTAEKKRRIRTSRADATRTLAEALAGMERPPRVVVCASAVGFYGDRGDEVLDEGSAPGEGFLADVCREWEAAADPLRDAGVRVVHVRIGIVLSAAGGALQRMLPAFRLGVGGPIGTGRQWFPWIALDDLVGLVHHALVSDHVSGPLNAVAPEPVRFREFAKTLGRVLSRPAVLPAPAFAIRAALGEMSDALLSSARAVPRRTLASGFEHRHGELESALRLELGRPRD